MPNIKENDGNIEPSKDSQHVVHTYTVFPNPQMTSARHRLRYDSD